MSYFKAVGASGLLGGGVYAIDHFSKKIQEKYPPSGEELKIGTMVMHNGKEKVVVGFFGANSKTFEKGLDPNRELYTGTKKQAQEYALSRAKKDEEPMVAVVLADEKPRAKDYGMQRFEGSHIPLSTDYIKKANVTWANVEKVTESNRLGFWGSCTRLINDMNKQDND
ncbi:MAG: hypothetical protein JJU12_02210 [Chlamydiales bacterium]|nr:hypothetical protein [Chlamydiales bacterium]